MKNEDVNELSMRNELYFSDIVDRLKKTVGLKTDTSIAAYLNMSTTAFSNRKKTGSVPYVQIIAASMKNNILLDYIFTGIPPVKLGDVIEEKDTDKEFDPEALEISIACIELYIDELDLKVSPAKKAKVIRMLYPLIRDDVDSEVPDNVIDLLKLASEAEEEKENSNEQKEQMVESNKSQG